MPWWSVYILDVDNKSEVIEGLRQKYGEQEGLFSMIDNPPIRLMARKPNIYSETSYDLRFYDQREAREAALFFRNLGSYTIIIPHYLTFEQFFESANELDKEKLIYHLDYFNPSDSAKEA
jgi:hypothetical protein